MKKVKIVLNNYLSLTKLLKTFLYNYFIVEISVSFLNN